MEIFAFLLLALALLGILYVYGTVFVLIGKAIFYAIEDLFGIGYASFNGANTESILQRHFSYYRHLSMANRSLFTERVNRIATQKQFIGRKGLQVTDEMRILVSGSLVQITLGLEEYDLDFITKFFIYPEAFYNNRFKRYHKGETNLAGAIALSWADFMQGYKDDNDNLNLGLHEMAHALRAHKIRSLNYDRFFGGYYSRWWKTATPVFEKIRDHAENSESYFRKYGGTNEAEFFSVCIEYFFESPKTFLEKHPELYGHTCILLNQNPIKHEIGVRKNLLGFSEKETRATGEVQLKFSPSFILVAADTLRLLPFALGYFFLTMVHTEMTVHVIFISILAIGTVIYWRDVATFYFYSEELRIRYLLPVLRNHQIIRYTNISQVELKEAKDDVYMIITHIESNKISRTSIRIRNVMTRGVSMLDFLKEKGVPVKQGLI